MRMSFGDKKKGKSLIG